MNDVLKQRLVGALILVALGVVFWPIIFVEPGEQGAAGEARIPPRPEVVSTPIEPPDIAGLRPSREFKKETEPEVSEQIAPAQPTPAAAPAVAEEQPVAASPPPVKPAPAKKTRSEPPVKPALDADGIPVTWILRVASVSSADKSDQLRKELLAMGHKAYVQKVNSGGRTLYRVYIGPKVEKARLEKIRGDIDARFGVTSMITRYYP
ncbi:SPOR domain-containing protein [Pseudohalioglobus lutimaris]|uniref:SPOR domain-containing protein n=1 Tax=Pseudohalioglobus lutimaris TaxID=1737061 RepID=A0A2N5X4L2_9GAMM|nr:SPOR domain-containing protein [Pseudohalioglobus lutimaris]PLW69428.1 hypothetical protein C0039_07820 [Pseudohalioglobus lutimaris]